MTDPTDQTPQGDSPIVHLYVLLDRSGSMASIADDVIGGFNALLADQQADGADARFTLVQFDNQDPEEVIADAVPITEMVPLDASTFQPRGMTPLLDATGRLISRVAARQQVLSSVDKAEDVVFVSITDGHENASRELSLAAVRKMVDQRTNEGWTFVFLSAALDVYGESGGLGYDDRSSQAFAPDPDGARVAFESLSVATRSHRGKVRRNESFDKGDFFEGQKAAESDRRRKEG